MMADHNRPLDLCNAASIILINLLKNKNIFSVWPFFVCPKARRGLENLHLKEKVT